MPQPPQGAARWIIRVKPGVYRERAYVQRERGNIALFGDGAPVVRMVEGIHANLFGSDGKKIGTFRTPTLQIDGDGFEVRGDDDREKKYK